MYHICYIYYEDDYYITLDETDIKAKKALFGVNKITS